MNADLPRGRAESQMCNQCGLRLDADEMIAHLRQRVEELEAALAGLPVDDSERRYLTDNTPIFERV
jgi:hypothetical protein